MMKIQSLEFSHTACQSQVAIYTISLTENPKLSNMHMWKKEAIVAILSLNINKFLGSKNC